MIYKVFGKTWLSIPVLSYGLMRSMYSWREAAGYINFAMILWLYNLARGWGLVEYGRTRYQKFGKNRPQGWSS
jgi:predicted aldo/keto reductase-like oxidoreductase